MALLLRDDLKCRLFTWPANPVNDCRIIHLPIHLFQINADFTASHCVQRPVAAMRQVEMQPGSIFTRQVWLAMQTLAEPQHRRWSIQIRAQQFPQ